MKCSLKHTSQSVTHMQSFKEICDMVQNGYEDHRDRDRLLNVHDPYHILLGGVGMH